MPLLSGGPGLGAAGGPIDRGGEVHVAPAPLAPLGHHQALAMGPQVADQLAGFVVEHLGAGRHAQDHVLAAAAVPILVRAGLPRGGLELALVAKVEQRRQPAVDDQHDAGAVAAVSPRGAALGNELFAPERDRALAAITRLNADYCFVDEMHGAFSSHVPRRSVATQGTSTCTCTRTMQAAGMMLAIVRGPDLAYFTLPSRRANSVKSRPMPTYGPGWTTVPDLTNQDVAGGDAFASVTLDPPALRVRVAAVAGAALSFFVCHG